MKILSRLFRAAFFPALFSALTLLADEGNYGGVVTARTRDSITLAMNNGKTTQSFACTPKTRYIRGRDETSATDVEIGDVAALHVKDGVVVLVMLKPKK